MAAAAALLRSVARKMALAPPVRPLLARGSGSGAGAGAGLGTPLIAAAEFQSLATHVPRHHRLLHTSPNSNPGGFTIEGISSILAKARPGMAYFTVFITVIYLYGYEGPNKNAMQAKLDASSREWPDLLHAVDKLQAENNELKIALLESSKKPRPN
ncbi:hypothetical protein PVAP13_3NG297300 [Panicum virgatum]|uniref:Uncharacterized protein n=1 Tax=Panicum virgatum TaxID=38727 RepID=A0A8T0UMA7_PANVG|nr:hypothetical protein PVAP13_3NG297300 [Panicum virgatum]